MENTTLHFIGSSSLLLAPAPTFMLEMWKVIMSMYFSFKTADLNICSTRPCMSFIDASSSSPVLIVKMNPFENLFFKCCVDPKQRNSPFLKLCNVKNSTD